LYAGEVTVAFAEVLATALELDAAEGRVLKITQSECFVCLLFVTISRSFVLGACYH